MNIHHCCTVERTQQQVVYLWLTPQLQLHGYVLRKKANNCRSNDLIKSSQTCNQTCSSAEEVNARHSVWSQLVHYFAAVEFFYIQHELIFKHALTAHAGLLEIWGFLFLQQLSNRWWCNNLDRSFTGALQSDISPFIHGSFSLSAVL